MNELTRALLLFYEAKVISCQKEEPSGMACSALCTFAVFHLSSARAVAAIG